MPAWLEKILALAIFIAVMTTAGLYWRDFIDTLDQYWVDIGLTAGIFTITGFWLGRWDGLRSARINAKPKQDS
jgi:integral membrane sensor domain MASE1